MSLVGGTAADDVEHNSVGLVEITDILTMKDDLLVVLISLDRV